MLMQRSGPPSFIMTSRGYDTVDFNISSINGTIVQGNMATPYESCAMKIKPLSGMYGLHMATGHTINIVPEIALGLLVATIGFVASIFTLLQNGVVVALTMCSVGIAGVTMLIGSIFLKKRIEQSH